MVRIIDLDLATMSSGDAVRLFNEALERVLEDIVDVNTPAAAKRSITLKVSLHPNEDRNKFSYDVEVKTSLPGMKPTGSEGYISHGADGVTATEVDPEQQTIQDAIDQKQREEEAAAAASSNVSGIGDCTNKGVNA